MGLKKLCDHSELAEEAAKWFAAKWGIPASAYFDSIMESAGRKQGIPQWYVFVDRHNQIIAGAGLIDNDFHERKELRPNLCSLFVEPACRGCGIAKQLLDFARKEADGMGIERLYLVTDHTEFYEKCGWEFLTMVRDEEGSMERMYTAVTR